MCLVGIVAGYNQSNISVCVASARAGYSRPHTAAISDGRGEGPGVTRGPDNDARFTRHQIRSRVIGRSGNLPDTSRTRANTRTLYGRRPARDGTIAPTQKMRAGWLVATPLEVLYY